MTDELTPQALDDGDARDPVGRATVRRWVATGVAVSMITGVLGFVAGRASVTDDEALVSAGDDTESVEPVDTLAPVETAAAVETTPPSAADTDQSADTVAPASGDGIAPGEYAGDQLGAYPDPPMTPLFERTTADGIDVRVLRMDQPILDGDYGDYGFPGGWTPAAWCYPSGSLRIELVTPDAAQVAWASLYGAGGELPKAQTFAGGYPQNVPFYGLSLQVDDGVASASFTANGATDEAAVIGGIAVLAVPGPIDSQFEVTLLGSDGATEVLGEDDLVTTVVSDRYLAECTPPPPSLPEAGDQPADPEAARAAVEAAFEGAYARDGTGLEHIDDPTGVQEARDKVGESTYADTAATAELTIDELVFTTPTEAWFRYSIRADVSSFNNRYGIARLGDDGVWRITRATVCQDLALIPDGGCDPAVDPILPPSAQLLVGQD